MHGWPRTSTFTQSRLRPWRHHGQFSTDELDTYARASATVSAANATHRFYRALVSRELPRLLRGHDTRHLRVPTLHLNGEYDTLTQALPDLSSKYADDMIVETAPAAGHFIADEQPARTVDRIDRFMRA